MDVFKQPRDPEPAFCGEDESFIATATVVVTLCPPECSCVSRGGGSCHFAGGAFSYLVACVCALLYEHITYEYLYLLSVAIKGYTFEAQADGQLFKVTLPMGGVEEGQKFQVLGPSGIRAYYWR
jgi:hypothetical protein